MNPKELGIMLLVTVVISVGATGFAQAQSNKTVTGEVVDTFCFTTMGARGAGHRSCGLACAKKGIPVGLLEAGTGDLYILLPAKDKEPVPQAAVNKMGKEATITGQVYEKGGERFLTVASVK